LLRDWLLNDLRDVVVNRDRSGDRLLLGARRHDNSMIFNEDVVKRLTIEHLSERVIHTQVCKVNAEFPVRQFSGNYGLHPCGLIPQPQQAVQCYGVRGD